MWDNLTLKQKAEVMKLAVQQGISDLDSIRDLYNTSVNTFSVGGAKNNKKKSSGYSPSTSIKKQVTQWEGASMHSPAPDTGKVNRSFDDEAKDFNAVNRSLPGFDALPQASKDALFSYSYNVGVGNYKNRVHPVLKRFLMGQATVEDVQNSMWASKDSDPRMSGLRRRRAVERNLFAEGLGQNGVAYTSDDIPEEITWENYKKRQAAKNMQILNDRMNAINKSFTSATSTPTIIIPDLSNQPEIKDEDYLIKDTPKQNKGIGILPAIKLITQGPGALLSSLTPASSSNSLLGFLPSIKFDKGGSKINQQDLDRNNWRWATRGELQEDDPLINTVGDDDKWLVNSEGRLVPTSKVNEWLNSYERQTPYQEQNDIATAREIELKQQYRANKEFNRQMDNFWGFNWMYPSQILGAFNPAGDNRDIPFAQRLFLGTGNTGTVSHKFAAEHPYLATGANLLFDIAAPGAVLKGVPEMYGLANKFYGPKAWRTSWYNNITPGAYSAKVSWHPKGKILGEIPNALKDYITGKGVSKNPKWEPYFLSTPELWKAFPNGDATELHTALRKEAADIYNRLERSTNYFIDTGELDENGHKIFTLDLNKIPKENVQDFVMNVGPAENKSGITLDLANVGRNVEYTATINPSEHSFNILSDDVFDVHPIRTPEIAESLPTGLRKLLFKEIVNPLEHSYAHRWYTKPFKNFELGQLTGAKPFRVKTTVGGKLVSEYPFITDLSDPKELAAAKDRLAFQYADNMSELVPWDMLSEEEAMIEHRLLEERAREFVGSLSSKELLEKLGRRMNPYQYLNKTGEVTYHSENYGANLAK